MSAAPKLAFGIALAIGLVALGVHWLERPPAGPVEPAWDRDHCAHCHMAVSDPHFAAEIQTADGRVLFFDDPGCLLHYEEANHPTERAVYFHHSRDARWLARAATGFVKGARTPMDWGLAAVDRDEAARAEPNPAEATHETAH